MSIGKATSSSADEAVIHTLSKEGGKKKALVPENFLRRGQNNGANFMEQRIPLLSRAKPMFAFERLSWEAHRKALLGKAIDKHGQRAPPKSLLCRCCGCHLCWTRADRGGHRYPGPIASALLLPHLEIRNGTVQNSLVSSQPA